MTVEPKTTEFTGAIGKKIAALPMHIQAGLKAYREALAKRQDWHRAVTAAIRAAEDAANYVPEGCSTPEFEATVRRITKQVKEARK